MKLIKTGLDRKVRLKNIGSPLFKAVSYFSNGENFPIPYIIKLNFAVSIWSPVVKLLTMAKRIQVRFLVVGWGVGGNVSLVGLHVLGRLLLILIFKKIKKQRQQSKHVYLLK